MYRSCITYLIVTAAAALILFTGCGSLTDKREEASRTGLYFDTPVTIRIYDENAEALLDGCFEICDELQGVLSAYESSSELYRLNNRSSSAVEVSEALSECIKMGIEAGNMSGGEFDITIYPVSSLWDFRSGEGRVPDASDIKKALRHVDYTGVKAEGGVIELRDSEAKIDLGAVAKGFISGRIRSYLRENGCDGAVINLGGNVSTVGVKPDGGSFKVGVQKPFEDRGAVSAVVQMQEGCIISSGTYERYFVQNGITYHHILSAGTGYPADTGLVQVTVIGNDDMLCDTLSTVGILLGRERTETLLDEKGYDVGLIFTEDDGRMTLYKPGSGEREISEGEVIDLTDKTREFEQ